MFPKIGVFPPKWMVYFMENPINPWMIWGYHYFFGNIHIFSDDRLSPTRSAFRVLLHVGTNHRPSDGPSSLPYQWSELGLQQLRRMGREASSFYHIGTHDLKASIFYRGYKFYNSYILGVEKNLHVFPWVLFGVQG